MGDSNVKGTGQVPAYYLHGFRWYVLFVYSLVNALLLFAVMGVAGIAPRVMAEYAIGTGEFSLLTSITYLTGFLTCLFFGSFIDRYGARNIMLFGLIVGAIGCVIRAAIPTYMAFVIGNFIIGFTFSALNAAVVKVFKAWFAPGAFNVAIGIYVGVASAAAAIAMTTAVLFPTTVSLLWFDVGFYVVCIIATIFVKNKPEDGPEDTSVEKITQYLGKTLKYKSVWMAALAYFILYGASNAGNIFMVNAMITVHGATEAEAALVSMIGCGGCIFGSLILPAVTSKVGKIRPCMMVYSACCAVILALAWNLPYGPYTAALLFGQAFFLGGLLAGTKSLPGLIPELPIEYTGTAGGFQACLQNLGAFLIPTFILAPIAGDSMYIMFMLVVAVLVIYFIWMIIMPRNIGIIKKNSELQQGAVAAELEDAS